MSLHQLAPRTALALFAMALAVLTVAGASASAAVPPPDVPSRIQVEDGHKPYLLAHATGVQIYTCSSTADGPKWRLLAPRATLYGDNGQLIGTHFGGPTWEARDGSFVKAQRVDGVTVDPDAIPWLLLKATPQSVALDGDRLAGTTFIQRIATTGGLEPAAGECTAETIGSQQEIPYTADYVFWKATAA
jgi:hypothetical protein